MGYNMLNCTALHALFPTAWKRKTKTQAQEQITKTQVQEQRTETQVQEQKIETQVQEQKIETQVQEQRTNLSMLPAEILQNVSDFLPVSSAVSFTLCSRRVLWLLGDQAFRSLRSTDQTAEKKLFLTLLEKDLPDRLLCHHCILFHPVAQDNRPENRWRFNHEPECDRASGVIHMAVPFKIRYRHAQLLMNHYRFRRAHQINLERLSYQDTRTYGNMNIKTETWGRIVLGELLVRVHLILRLPSSSFDIKPVRLSIPRICPHLFGLQKSCFESQKILCRPCHAGRLPCVECSNRQCCRECSTWFQVSGRERENLGIEIQIDIWRYLGSCETPFDAKWQRQVSSSCSFPMKFKWLGKGIATHMVSRW